MRTIEIRNQTIAPSEFTQIETLIASIAGVTKKRERVTLEDWLSRLLVSLTGAKTLTIYHLEPKDDEMLAVPVLHWVEGGNVQAKSAQVMPFLLSSNPALADSLHQLYAARDADEAQEIVKELFLPLQGSKGAVSAYCRLENARNDANTRRVLPLLLDFYMNFLTLLDDNERDMLTGLLNRKTFDLRIAKVLTTLQSQKNRNTDTSGAVTYCLATMDIDHFKRINDTFGHIYGDEVLLLFSNLMKKTFRDNDLLFRFGGEEFVVLLAIADVTHVCVALERFRTVIETYDFPQIGQVTVSIGVALISPDEMPRTTIDRADQALYFAKQNGRNQVRVHEDLVQQGLLKTQSIKTGEIDLF